MNSYVRFILKNMLMGLAIASLGAVALWVFQDKLIYPSYIDRLPENNPEGYRNPGEKSMIYEEVNIKTSDHLNLHGWLIKTANPSKSPTVVMFHGNAGNIGSRIPYVERLYKWCDTNVLIVGYRGYSYSEGSPSEKGLQKDSLAVLDYAFSRKDILDVNRIYILGSSIGGAVSIYGQSQGQYKIAGLILENTFTTMAEVVDEVMPAVKSVKWLLLGNYWNSIERIAKIKSPILFISGLEDEMLPPEMMNRLYKAASASVYKEKVDIPAGTHNDTWYVGGQKLYNRIRKFMDRVESSKGY